MKSSINKKENNMPKIAIFLLGGKGTRLRPLTYHTPKALLKIQGKTIPEHLFDLFKKYGIHDFVFSLGYKANMIKSYFGDGSKFGVKIIYVVEKTPLGSAGAIKLARKHLENKTFIVTNGDELKDINLKNMFKFHKMKKAKITIALTKVANPSEYGVAEMNRTKIINFIEKPTKESAPSKLINSGLSIWDSSVIKTIPSGFSMYEKDILPLYAKKGQLYGYSFKGQWFDTGTPDRYKIAEKEWNTLSNSFI